MKCRSLSWLWTCCGPSLASPAATSCSPTGGRKTIRSFGLYKAAIDARATGLTNWRFHDLRRTARTNLASLGVTPFIAELILGHQQRGVHKVYDVHRYQSEKRDALERWASKLRTIITPPPANVVAIKGGRAV
jgi:integrase